MRQLIRDLMVLTKFRINVVGVVTGGAALAMHAATVETASVSTMAVLLIILGLFLTGSAANATNQVIEVKRDRAMARTKDKRPLPAGRLKVSTAILVIVACQLLAMGLFAFLLDSWLAAWLSLFTTFYYAVIYTWWLKPRHHWNIVIGGVPGAMGPLIAVAAVAQDVSLVAWAMFGLVFLWTPPHFWALAIKLKDDYAAAGIPMLPVVKGVDETTKQIFWSTVVLVVFSLAIPLMVPAMRFTPLYVLAALIGGAYFLRGAWRLHRVRPTPNSMPLFHYSLLYIGILFLGLLGDAVLSLAGLYDIAAEAAS
jgi:protoheme IX farnesyltransferase